MAKVMGEARKCNLAHGGLLVEYKRPLRRLFRKSYVIVCVRCGLEIEEPWAIRMISHLGIGRLMGIMTPSRIFLLGIFLMTLLLALTQSR
jgi:hypothetical protein